MHSLHCCLAQASANQHDARLLCRGLYQMMAQNEKARACRTISRYIRRARCNRICCPVCCCTHWIPCGCHRADISTESFIDSLIRPAQVVLALRGQCSVAVQHTGCLGGDRLVFLNCRCGKRFWRDVRRRSRCGVGDYCCQGNAMASSDVCCLMTRLKMPAAGGLKLRHDRKGLLSVANQGPSEL